MNATPARPAAPALKKKPDLSVVGQADKFNAIQKVCAILRVLAQNSPLRLTEIADATSLNKATTLRILGSLIDEGFVSRVAGAKTYELGQEARVMAISARRTVDIAELAQPSLLRLSEPGGGFLRRNAPAEDRWYSRDVAAIARAHGLDAVAPYFIDADAATAAQAGTPWPRGGLTVVRFRDNHLGYALTWFALALLVAGGAWRLALEETRVRRRWRRRSMEPMDTQDAGGN